MRIIAHRRPGLGKVRCGLEAKLTRISLLPNPGYAYCFTSLLFRDLDVNSCAK
jgi:hypothetical protein